MRDILMFLPKGIYSFTYASNSHTAEISFCSVGHGLKLASLQTVTKVLSITKVEEGKYEVLTTSLGKISLTLVKDFASAAGANVVTS